MLIRDLLGRLCESLHLTMASFEKTDVAVAAPWLRDMTESAITSIVRLAVYEDPANHSEQWIQVLTKVANESGQSLPS